MGAYLSPPDIAAVIQRLDARILALENMRGAVPQYTTATMPQAGAAPQTIIYVSDAAAGAKFQGSNGTAWVSLG
jgi:hypothetical protein